MIRRTIVSLLWVATTCISLGIGACVDSDVVGDGDSAGDGDGGSAGDGDGDSAGDGDGDSTGDGDGDSSGDGDGDTSGDGDGDTSGDGDGDSAGDGDGDWSTTDEGWTMLEPSSDSVVVYVSSSQGDDKNDGLSENSPVKTLSKGADLLRDGYPDHLLLRRGDTWTSESLGRFFSGRSAEEPMVVSYYGADGARPLLRLDKSFINHDGESHSFVALVGLSLINYKKDPDDPAYTGQGETPLRYVGGGEGLLVEDCRFQYIEIVFQSYNGNYDGITFRRNMVLDAYVLDSTTSSANKPSGMFISNVKNLTIEENVIDHNGWSEDVPTAGANQFNHNVYIQYDSQAKDIVFRNNIVTRGSSHGVHGRPGGLYEDNLFVANSIGLQMGYGGHPLPSGSFATARDNVILDGKLMDPTDSSTLATKAVWGLQLDDLGQADVTLERNIAAHRRDSGSNVGISDQAGVTYTDNVQYLWGGGIGDMNDSSWLDPDRSVGSYHGTLGQEETLEAFLEVVRNRPLGAWNPDYSAPAVNDYIREGFNLSN